MDEEICDRTSKGETLGRDTPRKADAPIITILKGRNPDDSIRFTDSEEMNPDEPWILRDPDEKGLIRRYWRRKEMGG
jgi:hypothetical protein